MKNEYKKALQKQITIHWWNMGTKTLDHKGTYGEFFKKKGIKFKLVKDKKSKYNNYFINFNIPIGNKVIKLKDYISLDVWDLWRSFDLAIELFLTTLGDKTLFKGYTENKINWR